MSTMAEPDTEDAGEPVHVTISIPDDPSLGDAAILPPPLTAAETRALRDSFSWEAMTPLRELDREGRPILHYALVYVTSREAHEALTQLDLHHSYLPLFESERTRWDGMAGLFTHEGDGRGVFAFAFLPATFINQERVLALAGQPTFDAIIVRDVPEPAARARDGGISYEWLRGEHFLYNGRAYVPPASAGDSDVGAAREALLGGTANRIATAIANAAEAAVEAVRKFIGEIDIWWNGSVRMRLIVTPLNTDPSFVGGSPMLQAWGANRGNTLRIDHQPVHVSQGASLFVTTTDAAGTARLDVVAGRSAIICVESEAPAAYVTRFLVPSSMCRGRTPATVPGSVIDVRIRVPEMNVLAQLDDARAYIREVHGYTMHQPKVAVGGVADILGTFNGGRAFAPCFDLPVIPPIDAIGWVASLLDFAVPVVGTFVGTSAEFLLDYDILIPTTNGERSRGVPTHEYGHFVMCDMLNEEGSYVSTWVPMLLQLAQGRGDTASQLNEGFADFISSQVVGGVNYFQTSLGPPTTGNGDSFGQQWYCDPASSLCVDDNVGGQPLTATVPLGQRATNAEVAFPSLPASDAGLFALRTARMMTTIADAFDGQFTGGNVPGNGAAWTLAPGARFGAPVIDSVPLLDESVTLGAAPGFRGNGFGLRQVVRAFTDTHGGRLDVQFFRGMTNVMRSAGFTDTEICELYILHDFTGTCPGAFFDTPPDIVPSAPVDLAHTLVTPNTATWSWRDVSPVAGARFDYEIADASSVFQSGRLPYARSQTLTRSVLPRYDMAITYRVRTVSPSLRVSAWTEDRLWSLAEPARNLRTSGATAGRLPLGWTAVRATEYGVVVTDASGRHEVARVASPSFTLDTFDGGALRVEIVSYNREGVPSTPSAPLVLSSTLPAPILHVAPGGDDTASGDAATPLATLSAALARAATFGVATIRVAGDLYTSSALSVPRGVVVRVEGGYAFPSWSRPHALTRVRVDTATVGGLIFRGCGAVVGDWSAGVHVAAGARLYLNRVGLTAFPSDMACTAAVELEGATLDLSGSELSVNLGGGGNCAVGVLGAGVTGQALTLAARTSRISGAEKSNPSDAAAQLAAVCLANAQSVLVEDCTLTGITTDPGVALRARSASGLVLTQASSVDVVRSVIASVSPGPHGVEGAQTGVLLRELLGRARLANSLVRTVRGSESNEAISAHGVFGSGSLSLFYVTALAGDDYDRTEALPPVHRSAPVALSGALNAVRILNSVLANGAGLLGDPTDQRVIAGIDRDITLMTADPLSFELRGTAISFPYRDLAEAEALTFCRPDGERFLGGIYDEGSLNVGRFHRCYPLAGAGSYTASSNLAFSGDPDDLSGTTRPAARFDVDGRPLPTAVVAPATTPGTIAIDTLRAAGVDLTAEPVAVSLSLTRDLGSTVRLRAPPGAGAWVLP